MNDRPDWAVGMAHMLVRTCSNPQVTPEERVQFAILSLMAAYDMAMADLESAGKGGMR